MTEIAGKDFSMEGVLEPVVPPMEKNQVGILLFIISEAVFFVLLLLSYLYYRVVVGSAGPNAKDSLDPLVTGLYSLCLFSSSFTVWRAEVSMKKGQQKWQVGWLLITVILGAVFLFGQGQEYLKLISKNVTIDRNLFGTSFFTLTGFHALHVLIGLVMLTSLTVFAWLGDFKSGKSSTFTVISLYWHFVDVVWVVIFSVVYLGSLLS